jgi:AcrR family transcriptional regulator
LTVTTVSCNDRYMSSRKTELRDAALAYLLEHGLANVSLRPMAVQLETSPRILMFHFKSKEGLLQEVLQELHSRLQSSFLRLSRSPGRDVPPLKRFWVWAIGKKNFAHLRLLYEAHIVAAQNPRDYGRYLKKASQDWQTIAFQTLSKSLRSTAMATLCIAVFDGLMLEMMNTGDRARLTQALDAFIAMASAHSKQMPQPRLR